MIDFHSHFLPAVDDGSANPVETENMLKASYLQGVRHIVATPHFYADTMNPESFLEKRRAALTQISWDEGTMPHIHLGAEVAYYSGISHSQAVAQLQIGNTGLLLVEMPMAPWTDRMVADVCSMTERQGLTPILAHIDRYRLREQFPRYWGVLMDAGVLLQYNAGCFLRTASRSWALRQLKRGCVHFLGSDAHNMTTRPPMLKEAAQVIGRKLGNAALKEITSFSAQMLGVSE